MGGNEDHADLYFRRALEEIKKSGDLETLARAFLIRMALQRAVLSRVETEEFVKIAELSPNERNETYFYFLLGETDKVKPNLLPGYYITFFEALSKPDALQVVRSVGSIDDPLSRLVACGIAVEKGIVSEDLLKIAINTASHMGWKRALVSYMKFTVDFYEKRGKKEQAENVRARLKIIEK
ncbi:MAG: hypothetical protein N2317_02965 [Syntrophales bacterium]|nr:hypothetical protein [Syntrophales bacterium]